MRYVALLRGINVGGKNLIPMIKLKTCFEEHGFREVTTYIQSGNVLLSAPASERSKLASRLEQVLCDAFKYPASVVLRTQKQMSDVVHRAPRGFGTKPDKFRYDVLFLKEPLTAKAVLQSVPTKEGVDEVHAGVGVLYFSRLISKATQSKLSKVVSMSIYKSMTIRNWNTTTKLLQMMEKEGT